MCLQHQPSRPIFPPPLLILPPRERGIMVSHSGSQVRHFWRSRTSKKQPLAWFRRQKPGFSPRVGFVHRHIHYSPKSSAIARTCSSAASKSSTISTASTPGSGRFAISFYVFVSFTVPWLILTAGRPCTILTMPISLPQPGQTGREPVGAPDTPTWSSLISSRKHLIRRPLPPLKYLNKS